MQSFRARLTLWNAIVIAIVLVAFSTGIVYANQARLASDIDRELADRAIHVPPQGGPRGFAGASGQAMPGQMPPGNPPDGSGPSEPGVGVRESGPMPPRFSDPAAIRFADVRRPRLFDESGRPLGFMRDPAFDEASLRRAIGGESVYSNGEFDGEPIRIYSTLLRQGPNAGQAVQVARQVGDLNRIWSAQLWTLLLFIPGAILFAAAGASFLTNRAIRPISQMKEAASAISGQDLSRRLAIEGKDEFAELGQTFNAMVERLEQSFAALQTAYASLEDAHETQKRFTADASHELRTPLTRLRLATSSALAPGATEEDRNRALETADQAAESMARLVQEMLVLARADSGQLTMHRERIDLRVVATDVLQTFLSSGSSLIADLQDSPVTIDGDPEHLRRVLTNLIDNAIRHTPAGGVIKVTVCADEESAWLKVADSGEGIAPAHLPHLTERFYRVEAARSRTDGGVGLGLAICKTIAEAHQGEVTITSELGHGTTVAIRLPIAPTKSEMRS